MGKQSERLWTKDFVMLLSIDVMIQLGMYFSRPIISSYAVAFGASLALAGFLSGLNATAAMAMRPATGAIADRFSKKSLMMGSCALFALSGFGCALAPTIPLLTIFCAVQGVAFAIRSAVMTGMVALIVPESKIATGIGWMGISYTVGGALGPTIGAAIGQTFGYHMTFAAAGALYVAGLVFAAFFKAPEAAKGNKLETDSENASGNGPISRLKALFYLPAVPLALVSGLLMVAQGSINSLIVLLSDMDLLEGATLYLAVYAVVTMISKPAAGRIADRHGIAVMAVPCMALAASGMVLLAFERGTTSVIVAALCMGIGQASAYSCMQAEAVRKAPKDKVGRAANTFFIGPDLGMGLGPVISGYALGEWGVQTMFLFMSASIGLAASIFMIWWRASKKQGASDAEHPRKHAPASE